MKEDILGGLRIALGKGQTLAQAMQSFYNAGYKKEDIEEAAKEFQYEQYKNLQEQMRVEQPKTIETAEKPVVKQKVSQYLPEKEPEKNIKQNYKTPEVYPIQKVSNYGNEPLAKKVNKLKNKFWIILLIIMLVLLVSGIVLLFVYKEAVLEFLNKLFP